MARKKTAAKSSAKARVKKSAKRKTAKPAVAWELPNVQGKTFAFTGSLQYCDRAEAGKLIAAEGGTVAKSVTAALDYLVVGTTKGSGPSAAEKKASGLNQKGKAAIQVLDETDFHQLFVRDRDAAVALLQSGRGGVNRWNQTLGLHWLRVNVDVTNADFRDCDLRDAELSNANLDGGDFRGAKLKGAVIRGVRNANFDKATGGAAISEAVDCSFKNVDFGSKSTWDGGSIRAVNSNLDGANFKNGSVYGLVDCSAKRADLTDVRLNPADFSRANLTQAKLVRVLASYTQGAGACFDKADMREAEFDDSDFEAASFQKADLSRARLEECNFTGADLSGAKLEQADASRANFQNANLTKANLRGAMLSDADFTGAILDGADLTDAGVVGAKLTAEQIKSAKGITPETTQAGKVGPNIRELEKVAGQSKKLSTEIRADLDRGRHVHLSVQSWSGSWGRGAGGYESLIDGNSSRGLPGPGNSVSACMLGLANRWAQGTPRIDEIRVSASKSPLKRKELQLLATAAWCEAFGLDIPTEDDLKQRAKQAAEDSDALRETALADLRSGSAGVKKWNKLTEHQRKSIRRMRRIDLSGLDLKNADFDYFDFQGSNFSNADLQGAHFGDADLKKANFDNANAKGAWFSGIKASDASFLNADLRKTRIRAASLLRTSFCGAKLSGVEFDFSDLRGADFSGTKLKGVSFDRAKFDEKTVFPDDFTLTEDLIWAGQGKDPRLTEKIKQVQSTGPIDFETFMEQLGNNFDESRLKKSMKMLKAERFQLFAQVEDDSVTGVVKSQTDPDLVYSCRLDAEGTFACCTQNLNPCGGLRGALCKHLLVLIVGLTKGDELDPTTVNAWVAASKLQGPQLDKDLMSEVFLKYKGAEAGEIDWRPTETVPEDYYAF